MEDLLFYSLLLPVSLIMWGLFLAGAFFALRWGYHEIRVWLLKRSVR